MDWMTDLRRPAATAELERAREVLSSYQMFLGHDLPALLVPAQAFARLLAEAALDSSGGAGPDGGPLARRVADLVCAIDGRVRRLSELGRLEREPAAGPPLDLADVAREAVAEVTCAAPGLPHGCVVDVTLPAMPVARRLAHRALVELLRNAAQAVLTGRPATVEVGGSVRPPQFPDWGAALWVRDQGAGFPEAARSALETGRTAGVGLPLVRQVVARWGGGLHVRSAAGAGTTVTILFA